MMSAMTVVVTGDGARAAAVRELVAQWTRSGIVGPSVWVGVGDVVPADGGPPRVTATVVDAGGTRAVDLFSHIGRFRLDLVRVVVTHLVDVGAVEPAVADAGDVVANAIESVLPRSLDSDRPSTSLHRVVLVVPATGAAGVGTEVLRPMWEANLVISPEDRPDLDRSSVYVRSPGNFDGHAAAAVAAVGGVLRGVDDGVVDTLDTDSTSGENDVVVARVSIRSVIGEDVVDALARRVLDPASLEPGGPGGVVEWAAPASQPQMVVRQAAQHVLAQPEWAPTSLRAGPTPTAARRGLWASLRAAAAFNLRTVGAVASWTLSRGRVAVERRATTAIVGQGSGVLVTLGPRVASQVEDVAEDVLRAERDRLDERIRFEATRVLAPQPSTWTRLRTVALGLVDGGDLDGMPEPRQVGRRELLPPGLVAVTPGASWPTLDDEALGADDPAGMRRYDDRLSADVADAQALVKSLSEALEARRREVAKALAAARHTRQDSPDATAEAAPEGAEDNPPDAAAPKPAKKPKRKRAPRIDDDPEVVELNGLLRAAKSELDALVAHHGAYRPWFDAQAGTVLWQVGDDVGRRAAEQAGLVEQLDAQRADTSAPLAQRIKRARRALLVTWWISLAIWVAAVAYLVREGVLDHDGGWTIVWHCLIPTGVVIVVLAVANHLFYQAMVKYEWAVEQRIALLRQQTDAYLHAGRELGRLEVLYRTLRDWVRILGEVAHRPWSPPRPRFDELTDEVIEALPAAMGVARQSGDAGDLPSRVLVDGYRVVYQPGFASRAFERAYESFESLGADHAAQGHRDVDLDVGTSLVGARSRLREYWQTGEAREQVGELVLVDLHTAVQGGALELPMRVVGRLGPYGDGAQVDEPEFYQATARESTALTLDVFTPAGRQNRRHYVQRSQVWLPRAAAEALGSTDLVPRVCDGPTAVRVDLSQRMRADEVAGFTELAAAPDAEATPGPDAGLAQGVVWH